MPGIATIATLVTLGCAILSGQTISGQAQFEVASIKPSDQADSQKSINLNGGVLRAANYSLKNLIQLGWDVRSFQVVGGPGWLDSARYNVEAKPPVGSGTGGGIRQLSLMVQSLLADRFQLKLHRESKEMRVYFLTIGKNGTNLKQSGEGVGQGTSMQDGRGFIDARQIDMPQMARELGGVLGVPVLDKTDLHGTYNIKLTWSPDEDASAPVAGLSPSIFTALQEQLGLKLEPGRGPVEVLVVDDAAKASAN